MTQEKDIIVTGDRPTGRLHLGHYVGSLRRRIELQEDPRYKQLVFVADMQALTDNAHNPGKIRDNIIEVVLDYLSVGIDPDKTTIFIQSQIPELTELMFYYMNLVTMSRLTRNPTIKTEIQERGFGKSIPVGFMTYPISQAADITAFNAKYVPCGEDQEPLIEQTREIVRAFNSTYGDVLVEPAALLATNDVCRRLPGIDGAAKMGKSLGNAIYLADEPSVIKKKIQDMYTDPLHIHVEDPGHLDGNIPFIYLRAFARDEHFALYLPEYKNLDEMMAHYTRGGLGDGTVKKFLNNVLNHELEPIRARRRQYEQNLDYVYKILEQGCATARAIAAETLKRVRRAIGVEYFEDTSLKQSYQDKYKK
ncbi:MAG: tryptophan--tRNA ligase [Alphaproteobacteria bacterium]|nr:tryptophan--tRNA ligase [Alphaproteobacteria bacterium]